VTGAVLFLLHGLCGVTFVSVSFTGMGTAKQTLFIPLIRPAAFDEWRFDDETARDVENGWSGLLSAIFAPFPRISSGYSENARSIFT
jgi:hypothetical protein